MFSVYVHTNRQNGKRYVGITANDPATRWNHGRGYKSNKRFWPDIEALGWDAFDHEIVASGLTKQEAVEKEAELIREYDTVANGYNNELGGRYATQGFLRGDARLFYNGLGRLPQYRKAWRVWAVYYELLQNADNDGGQIAENLNLFCTAIREKLSARYASPRWNDVDYVDEFIWELDYIGRLHDALHNGKEPPPYESYRDAFHRKWNELTAKARKQNKKAVPVCQRETAKGTAELTPAAPQ